MSNGLRTLREIADEATQETDPRKIQRLIQELIRAVDTAGKSLRPQAMHRNERQQGA
jgi:hypothetical protein